MQTCGAKADTFARRKDHILDADMHHRMHTNTKLAGVHAHMHDQRVGVAVDSDVQKASSFACTIGAHLRNRRL